MSPFMHRVLNERATSEAVQAYRAFTLMPQLSAAFIVATYQGGRRTASPFNDLVLATLHADLNAPAFVYRAAQVQRIMGGVCHLKASDREPLYAGRGR